MTKLFVLDFETTGLDPTKDRAVEVAAIRLEGMKSITHKLTSKLNPGIPIPPEASAIHHIIAEDVAESPSWAEYRNEVFNLDFDIIVAHNAQFDSGFLAQDGGPPPGKPVICTWRMAKKLLPEIPSYSNMALHYRLGLPGRPEGAHRALTDALVTTGLYKHLVGLAAAKAKDPENIPLGPFLEWLDSPIVEKTVKFGKYQGRQWSEVAKIDTPYLRWLLDKSDMVAKNPDLRFTIETALRRT